MLASMAPLSALPEDAPFSAPHGENDEHEAWELNSHDLVLHESIGTGCTAVVYRGSWRDQRVAVKQIDWNASRMSWKDQLNLQREVAIMRRVRHDRLVNLVGVISVQVPFQIITEYCAGGCLFELLHNCDHVGLSWSQNIKMATDVAQAMDYLHKFTPQIIHRDLKSLNLLLEVPVLSESGAVAVKVSDFGLSRIKDTTSSTDWGKMTIAAGTCHWMAPEVFTSSRYDEKVDVYSYAMILFEIICREIPFEEEEPAGVGNLIVQGGRPDMEAVPPDCPECLRDLMQCCWAHRPDQRPSFEHILAKLDSSVLISAAGVGDSSSRAEANARTRDGPRVDARRWATQISRFHPLPADARSEDHGNGARRYHSEGGCTAGALLRETQRLRFRSGNASAAMVAGLVGAAGSTAGGSPLPGLTPASESSAAAVPLVGPPVPPLSLEEVLPQLRIEPSTDEERAVKFRLFEDYLSAVELIREQLLSLAERANSILSGNSSYATTYARVQRITAGNDAMGIEEVPAGRWFVHDMTRKAAQNNAAMTTVLRQIEDALEQQASEDESEEEDTVADTNSDGNVTGSASNSFANVGEGFVSWAHQEPDAQPNCPICIEPLGVEGREPHVLERCKHKVCIICWSRWTELRQLCRRTVYCPLCRREDFAYAVHRAAEAA